MTFGQSLPEESGATFGNELRVTNNRMRVIYTSLLQGVVGDVLV